VSTHRRLTPEEWARVNDLFHRAIDLPDRVRESFLDDQCGADARLRAEVDALVSAHDRTTGFLERPAAAWLDPGELDPLVGRELGHYVVTRRLGAGGMGVVYQADDTRLGRVVALKALAPEFTHDGTRRERLRREARAAAALTHPGIATVYALEEIDGHMYIASEFVPGETLRDELSRGPMPASRVIDLGMAISRALAAAHERGVIHRDLKPENVIALPDGGVKILDFGLARFREPQGGQSLTREGGVLGTPSYMSPEQIRGEPVDVRTDIFSLGVTLFELANGHNPFTGTDSASTLARILEAEPRQWSAASGSGPDAAAVRGLAAVVRRCLAKRPGDRFSTAREVVAALEAAREGLVPAWPSVPATRPAEGVAAWWWQFHQVAVTVVYGLLLVPLWLATRSVDDGTGIFAFVAGAVAVTTAAVFRLHLRFAATALPLELARQRAYARPWLRIADTAFVAVLAISGARVLDTRPELGVLLIAAAVVVLLVATVVEPATSRAALDARAAD